MTMQGATRAAKHRAALRGGRLPWTWIAVALAAAAVALVWTVLPVDVWAETVEIRIRDLGLWGVLAFAVLYLLGTLILAPGSFMSLAGGLAFGAWGVPIIVRVATTAAALAFLIARHLARKTVARLIENHPKFSAVDRAVNEEGWKVVALLRLSPLVPFNLQNYALGLTSIGFRAYVAATFFGIIPGTVLYVYLGALGQAALSGDGGVFRWTLFGIGLLATIAVTWLVARKARQKLRESGLEAGPTTGGASASALIP